MADPVYTGVIQDKGGAVYNVRGYGAVGDGVTDDTTAIRDAIAAVPYGGTLYIPTGKFRVTDTITINKPISIVGSGSASAMWLDLNSTTKTGVVIGLLAGDSAAENQTYANFGIFGPSGSCRYGLGVYHCHRARFENVHVRPGSSEHAVVVGGCLLTRFNFIVQNNSLDGYPDNSGTWNGAGILVADLRTFSSTPSTMPTNACVFDCIVEGGEGGGLAFQPQDQSGGNNAITGTYEGFWVSSGSVYGTGYALYIDGCLGFDLYDLHVEANVNGTLIKNSSSFTIRDSGFFSTGTQLEKLTLQSCADFTINRITVGYLTIEPTCVRYEVENVVGQKNPYSQPRRQDSFLSTFQDTSQGGIVAATGMQRFTAENLVPNGDLSRWPLGFGYLGMQPTLVRTGADQTDTAHRFNRYAAEVSGGAASGFSTRATLAFGVHDPTQYLNQPITVWADIKRISGAEISLGVFETVTGRVRWLGHVASTETEWVRAAVTYYPQEDWFIVISPIDDAAYSYYLGGVGALVGVAAPMGAQSAPASFERGLQVVGKRIEYGSAAPTTGEWQAGDIMFNLAPTAGGTVGWVCTATGSPGTWKTFGAISA
ncbi:MAG: glycoside hydrolase family 55 protein [Gemmatimonadetes bacterium]|nr:glycoside hydrolase family 55 protein [Gemmatimonadota bacterium]